MIVVVGAHCSLSMSISFSSKSLWRSWLGLSNRNVTESPVSSACIQGMHGLEHTVIIYTSCVRWPTNFAQTIAEYAI